MYAGECKKTHFQHKRTYFLAFLYRFYLKKKMAIVLLFLKGPMEKNLLYVELERFLRVEFRILQNLVIVLVSPELKYLTDGDGKVWQGLEFFGCPYSEKSSLHFLPMGITFFHL